MVGSPASAKSRQFTFHTAVAAVLGLLLTAALVAGCTAAPPPGETAPPRRPVGLGWNVYDWAALWPEQVAAIRAWKPGMLRWIVSWDRYESGGHRAVDWSKFGDFFAALAENHVQLKVQVWTKQQWWMGDAVWGGGMSWAKPNGDQRFNYPDDVASSYGVFVNGLARALRSARVTDVAFGAFNEAQLLYGTTFGRAAVNYTEPWYLFGRAGFSLWTGGTQKFTELQRSDIRGYKWSTSGIGADDRDAAWVEATVASGNIGEIDVRRYARGPTTPQQIKDYLIEWVKRFDRALGRTTTPFFVSEIGINSGADAGVSWTEADAVRIRKVNALLRADPVYGPRYRGMTLHEGQPWTWAKPWWKR